MYVKLERERESVGIQKLAQCSEDRTEAVSGHWDILIYNMDTWYKINLHLAIQKKSLIHNPYAQCVLLCQKRKTQLRSQYVVALQSLTDCTLQII